MKHRLIDEYPVVHSDPFILNVCCSEECMPIYGTWCMSFSRATATHGANGRPSYFNHTSFLEPLGIQIHPKSSQKLNISLLLNISFVVNAYSLVHFLFKMTWQIFIRSICVYMLICVILILQNTEWKRTCLQCCNLAAGVRTPINYQTSFLDLSHVYGTSVEENSRIRTGHAGRLNCLHKTNLTFNIYFQVIC